LYHAGKSEAPYEKIICPAKLLLYGGELYFVCMSEYYDKDFFIKISRIAKAELTKESFEPDPKRIKRIEDRLVKSFGIYDEGEPKMCKVVVRFLPILLQAHFFRKEIPSLPEDIGNREGLHPANAACSHRHGPGQLGAVVAGGFGG